MTNSMPVEVLEERAADQRRQLHNTVVELKSSLRESLDIQRAPASTCCRLPGAAAFLRPADRLWLDRDVYAAIARRPQLKGLPTLELAKGNQVRYRPTVQ